MTVVSRETRERLDFIVAAVTKEAQRQNLISAATLPTIEERHIADSLQLLPLIAPGPLVDIGSGAGFPGLVLACCVTSPVHLVEMRPKRADFLRDLATRLGLSHVEVWTSRIERIEMPPVATITARAVAALDQLFAMALHLSVLDTRWVLPKGRSVKTELEAVRRTWQGRFELVPSRTDPESAIVVARDIRRRHDA